MKYFIIITITLTIDINLVSQDDWMLYPSSDSNILEMNLNDTIKNKLNYKLNNGEVNIFKDLRIDTIQKEISKKPTILGWTIQILVSQQKEEIKNTKIKFLKAFPDQQLFDEYKTPNTYLYAGRYYDKISAYNFQNELSVLFQNTRVLKKEIELPKLPKKRHLNDQKSNNGNSE